MNADRLAVVYSHWLTNLLFVCEPAGYQPKQILDLFASFSENFSKNGSSEPDASPSQLSFRRRVRKAIWEAAACAPVRVGFLPGGATTRPQRIAGTLLHYKLNATPVSVDHKLRSHYLTALRPRLQHKYRDLVTLSLPDDLFRRQFNGADLPHTFVGHAGAVIKDPYLQILFVDRKVQIIGIQHGGYYGELKVNRFEDFENRLSDHFYHWGLGARNLRQTRFSEKAARTSRPRAMAVVGSGHPDAFLKFGFGGWSMISAEADRSLPQIKNELDQVGPTWWLIHPKNPRTPNGFAKAVTLSQLARTRDWPLFVLDRPGHTFLYEAIYERLPFVLLFREEWGDLFTPRFSEFLCELRTAGLLYHRHESQKYMDFVEHCLADGYPADLFQLAQAALERPGMESWKCLLPEA